MNSSILNSDQNFEYDGNDSQRLLNKLSASWGKRAQVRRCNIHDDKHFDLNKPDFLESLLPFSKLEAYQKLPNKDKNKLLTAGWLVYNTKTIDIEKEIIIPLCNRIIDEKFSGLKTSEAKRIASETMVDEAYHILLCVSSNEITMFNRNIDISLDKANVVVNMDSAIENSELEWQKDIILLATAFVSETIISDYLALLSRSSDVQPLHREVVHAHKLDEGVHRYVFVELIKCFLKTASTEQRRYLFESIPNAICWFQSSSIDAWLTLLDHSQVPGFSRQNEELVTCISTHREPVNGQKVLDLIPILLPTPLLVYSV